MRRHWPVYTLNYLIVCLLSLLNTPLEVRLSSPAFLLGLSRTPFDGRDTLSDVAPAPPDAERRHVISTVRVRTGLSAVPPARNVSLPHTRRVRRLLFGHVLVYVGAPPTLFLAAFRLPPCRAGTKAQEAGRPMIVVTATPCLIAVLPDVEVWVVASVPPLPFKVVQAVSVIACLLFVPF